MKFMVWSTRRDEPLSGPEEAEEHFDERSNPWGRQFTMYFGPDKPGFNNSLEDWPERALRVDVDFEADLSAVRWLPDGTFGADLDPSGSIVAGLSEGPEEIPAKLARVSISKAREIVREYLTTGVKPTCVRWETE